MRCWPQTKALLKTTKGEGESKIKQLKLPRESERCSVLEMASPHSRADRGEACVRPQGTCCDLHSLTLWQLTHLDDLPASIDFVLTLPPLRNKPAILVLDFT